MNALRSKGRVTRTSKYSLDRSVRKALIENSIDAWEFGCIKNAKTYAQNSKDFPRKLNKKVISKAETSLRAEHSPELDSSTK